MTWRIHAAVSAPKRLVAIAPPAAIRLPPRLLFFLPVLLFSLKGFG